MKFSLPVVPLLIGFTMLVGSGYAVWSEISFRDGAVETDGRVIDMLRVVNGGGSQRYIAYVPVFTFTLPNGEQPRVTGSTYARSPCCAVGEGVRVRYRPEAPDQAEMIGHTESWFIAIFLGTAGLAFMLIAGVLLFRTGRDRG